MTMPDTRTGGRENAAVGEEQALPGTQGTTGCARTDTPGSRQGRGPGEVHLPGRSRSRGLELERRPASGGRPDRRDRGRVAPHQRAACAGRTRPGSPTSRIRSGGRSTGRPAISGIRTAGPSPATSSSLARRQPALVFAGAFALGLVAARFLKSSDPGSSDEADYERIRPGGEPAGLGVRIRSRKREGSMHQLRQERSVGELFGQLTQDLSLLVRQETQLAKTEIQEKISRASRDLVALATGGVVALVGGLALTAAVILLLVDPVGLEPWLAALLVGRAARRGRLRDAPRRGCATSRHWTRLPAARWRASRKTSRP